MLLAVKRNDKKMAKGEELLSKTVKTSSAFYFAFKVTKAITCHKCMCSGPGTKEVFARLYLKNQ